MRDRLGDIVQRFSYWCPFCHIIRLREICAVKKAVMIKPSLRLNSLYITAKYFLLANDRTATRAPAHDKIRILHSDQNLVIVSSQVVVVLHNVIPTLVG